MPYIGITDSEKGHNKGSCAQLVGYLEKENKGKSAAQKEYFFSHTENYVPTYRVVEEIDHNKAQLCKEDAKFFLLNIAPSKEELLHIGSDKEKLKAYTRGVMEEYAKNFNKGLQGKDLLYFAKLETKRAYKGTDLEVIEGRKRQGEEKEGEQLHIHVIVSRKDAANKKKINPLTNHRNSTKGVIKGGFDRVNFKLNSISLFDRQFGYERKENELERHLVLKYGTKEERIAYLLKQYQGEQEKENQHLKRQKQKEDAFLKANHLPSSLLETEQIKEKQTKEASLVDRVDKNKGNTQKPSWG